LQRRHAHRGIRWFCQLQDKGQSLMHSATLSIAVIHAYTSSFQH
jgi:hypothetical protein